MKNTIDSRLQLLGAAGLFICVSACASVAAATSGAVSVKSNETISLDKERFPRNMQPALRVHRVTGAGEFCYFVGDYFAFGKDTHRKTVVATRRQLKAACDWQATSAGGFTLSYGLDIDHMQALISDLGLLGSAFDEDEKANEWSGASDFRKELAANRLPDQIANVDGKISYQYMFKGLFIELVVERKDAGLAIISVSYSQPD